MPINSKRGKMRFQLKKDIANAKSKKKKSSFMFFGVSKIKPLVFSKILDWLFIKEKVGFAL
jgi:hypothetical protein